MNDFQFMLTRDQWAQRVGGLPPGDVLPVVPGLIKNLRTEIDVAKDVNPETGMANITFTISSEAIDREDDVIEMAGWELDNYRQNPIVLWGHDYSSPPIGRALEVKAVEGKLMAVDEFTPKDMNPFGYMVYGLVRGGFLKATSVGFRPLEYVYNEEHKGYDFKRHELLEHSVVPVPANPEALIAASVQGIDVEPMYEWAAKVLDDPAGDRIALWLPRTAIEGIWKAARVAVGDETTTIISTGSGSDSATDGGSKDADDHAAAVTPDDPGKMNDEEEQLMKDTIKALADVVGELKEQVQNLPEKIATELVKAAQEKQAQDPPPVEPEPTKDADPEASDLSEDDVRAIVRAAVDEVKISQTGQLPD